MNLSHYIHGILRIDEWDDKKKLREIEEAVRAVNRKYTAGAKVGMLVDSCSAIEYFCRRSRELGWDSANCFLHLRGNRYLFGSDFFFMAFDAHSMLGRHISETSFIFKGRQEAADYFCSEFEDMESVLVKVKRPDSLIVAYEDIQSVLRMSQGTPSLLPIVDVGARRINAMYANVVCRVIGANWLNLLFDKREYYAGALASGESVLCGKYVAFLPFIVTDSDYEEMAKMSLEES